VLHTPHGGAGTTERTVRNWCCLCGQGSRFTHACSTNVSCSTSKTICAMPQPPAMSAGRLTGQRLSPNTLTGVSCKGSVPREPPFVTLNTQRVALTRGVCTFLSIQAPLRAQNTPQHTPCAQPAPAAQLHRTGAHATQPQALQDTREHQISICRFCIHRRTHRLFTACS
jgi:hypothetical protein